MFAYPDAARYRLGVNYQQLPCNRPAAPVYCPYQRDGFATVNGNYGADPNYVRSALKPVAFRHRPPPPPADAASVKHDVWAMGSVADYTSEVADEDFVQARAFWDGVLGRQEGQRESLVNNIAAHLGKAKPVVWQATFGKLHSFLPFRHSGCGLDFGR